MKNALFLTSILALFALHSAAAQGNDLRLVPELSELVSPCAGTPLAFDLSRGPDNSVVLAWVEKASDGVQSLRIASYSALKAKWTEAKTIAASPALLHPAHSKELRLSVDEAGRVAVVWIGMASHGSEPSQVFAVLSDTGAGTWKAPLLLSSPEHAASQASFTWRQGGGWIATWLETSGKDASQLCIREADQAQALHVEGSTPLVTAATTSVSFPDGTDLIVFRSFSPEEGCDPWMVRRFEGNWDAPQRLGREGWKGLVQASEAIHLSVSAPRISMAWFTAADDEPRILVTSSPDAGARWTQVTRVDLGHAVGAPDIVLLSDGSQLVAWIEGQGSDLSLPPGILLRRYSPGGGSVQPAYVIKDEPGNFPAGPRLAVLRDQTGEAAELIMAVEQGVAPGNLRILRLKLPSPEALREIDSSCNCSGASLPGFPIRGRILSVDTEHSLLRISHDSVPGVFRRGELEVQVSPAVVAVVREGRGIMGRIERSNGTWLMSDVRTYAVP